MIGEQLYCEELKMVNTIGIIIKVFTNLHRNTISEVGIERADGLVQEADQLSIIWEIKLVLPKAIINYVAPDFLFLFSFYCASQ